MVLLSSVIIFQLAVAVALVTIGFFGILLLVRKIFVKRKTLLLYLNLRIWIAILAAISLLSFTLLINVVKSRASKNILSVRRALDSCFILAAQNRIYSTEYKNWDTESVKIDDLDVIGMVTNIITDQSYELISIVKFHELGESVELHVGYKHNNQKQLVQFTISEGGILEIYNGLCLWRYKSTDKDALGNIRKIIGFTGETAEFKSPLPDKLTVTREKFNEFNEWLDTIKSEAQPNANQR